MQTAFCATAYLSSPFATGGGYMTLDGLLAARLFEELQDVEAAHAAVPIKVDAGLACASGGIYEPVSVERIVFDTGAGDDRVQVTRDAKTGATVITVNGERHTVLLSHDNSTGGGLATVDGKQ